MAELEQLLASIAAELAWPAAPDVAGRLELTPRRRRRRAFVLAVALALLALAVAAAVPQARSAILRLFHLGGVTIQRVNTLPQAEERPLAATLGRRVNTAQARAALGGKAFLVPTTAEAPALYEQGGFVSTLLAAPEPVLLSEFGSTGLMKKVTGASTRLEFVQIEPGVEGVWITGAPHVFFGPETPARLAGNVLLWETGGVTFRLEGRTLDQSRALQLARNLLRARKVEGSSS